MSRPCTVIPTTAGLLCSAACALQQTASQGHARRHFVLRLRGTLLQLHLGYGCRPRYKSVKGLGVQEQCSTHMCAQPALPQDSFCGPLTAYPARLDSNTERESLGQVVQAAVLSAAALSSSSIVSRPLTAGMWQCSWKMHMRRASSTTGSSPCSWTTARTRSSGPVQTAKLRTRPGCVPASFHAALGGPRSGC